MSGHVFHPHHHELHGITVVVETSTGTTYVGRCNTVDETGVHLWDAAEHRDAASRDEFLRSTLKFGVRRDHPVITVPGGVVVGVRRLAE